MNFRICFLMLACSLSLPALAQVEINVKLRANQESVETYFRSHEGKQISAEERSLMRGSEKTAFLQNCAFVQALQKKADSYDAVSRYFTLSLENQSPDQAIAALNASGLFEYVAENRTFTLDKAQVTEPNDDSLANQWYHSYLQTFEAWGITKGNSSVKIGVIDTGLDYEHPDLLGQVALNSAEDKNGNGTFEPWSYTEIRKGKTGDYDGIDQDNNGFADDVLGYDFTDQPRSPFGGDYLFADPNPMDDNTHGTFVTGIIAAKANNQIGAVGIAPDCKILPIRAFAANGGGEDDDISRAIVYAADNGVKVLNCSFGDVYPSEMMHAAVQYAYSKGVIIIASAGNGTGDNLHYPSGFNEVISISASTKIDDRETLWQLSSYGLTVSLCAPGAGIFSTALRDSVDGEWVEYMYASGTSASAPMVSAAAALLIAQRGDLSPQQVRGILTGSADDLMENGWDHYTGAGRLNIFKALNTTGASNVQILSPLNDSGTWKDSVWITGTVLDPQMSAWALEYSRGIEGEDNWITIIDNQTAQIAQDTLALWVVKNLQEAEYTLRLRVDRTNGFTMEDRIRFVRDTTAPVVEIKRIAPIWDNNERKVFVHFRSSDQGQQVLQYRKSGTTTWANIIMDKTTRNGEFLLGKENLSAGLWEMRIQSTNLTGQAAQSAIQSVNFTPEYVEQAGFNTLSYTLPMGAFLNKTFDFDNDGLKEIIASEYNERLNFGKIKFYEYNAGAFSTLDSISIKPSLIPKDIVDMNGDGKLDLLCSVNDSAYIFTQNTLGELPKQSIWTRFGDDLYAARFADSDNDGQLELLMKDYKDYRVFERNGNDFTQNALLPDVSPNYEGSIAPRALLADFDGDNKNEIIYGDFDGNFVVYEYDGSQYQNTFIDSTLTPELGKSGSLLTQGDFDGDGKQEFFVASYTSSLRNEDFEYDPPFINLRIFKATADNTYSKVWEEHLYDIDIENYNAATVGNVDTDTKDEIVFSTFPRTYIIEYENGGYKPTWFLYGTLATHHVIGDFNGNGVNEIAIGRGDTTFFWEKDFQYQGPALPTTLDGYVNDDFSTTLNWQAVGNAMAYEVWRGEYVPGNTNVSFLGIVATNTFTDLVPTSEIPYLYALRAMNPALTPDVSDFGSAVVLRPHTRNRVDSVRAISARQIVVYFTQKVVDRDNDKVRFRLNGQITPTAIVPRQGKTLVLTFDREFNAGANSLTIDSLFRDADLGPMNANSLVHNFNYTPGINDKLYLASWKSEGETEALLTFNLALTNQALDPANYEVSPFGTIKKIAWEGSTKKILRFTLADVVIGAVGYTVSISSNNLVSEGGIPQLKGEGNVATFSSNKADLSSAYVYPNPVRPNAYFEGLRFANLTQKATIKVYTLSGRYINTIEETDGDGGVTWDMTDERGNKITPGVYLFKASAEGVEEFLGKFTVVE